MLLKNLFAYVICCLCCLTAIARADYNSNFDKKVVLFNHVDEFREIAVLYNPEENVPGSRRLTAVNVGLEFYIKSENQSWVRLDNVFHDTGYDSNFWLVSKNTSDFYIFSNSEGYLFRGKAPVSRMSVNEVGRGYLISGVEISDKINLTLIENYTRVQTSEVPRPKLAKSAKVNLSDDFAIDSVIENIKSDVQPYFIFPSEIYQPDNTEGRVAWNDVYLLKALTYQYLNSRDMDSYSKLTSFFNAFVGEDPKDYMASKRYSFDRVEQFFLIHVSRLFTALSEVEKLTELRMPTSFREKMQSALLTRSLDGQPTVEQYSDQRDITGITCPTLIFNQKSNFWAAGVNTPLNYVSDYITALTFIKGPKRKLALELASDLMFCNLRTVPDLGLKPWAYWFGRGNIGWTDGLHVPVYGGDDQKYSAHISYLTNDARSILTLCESSHFEECEHLKDGILQLIKQGLLLPSLCEYINCTGVITSPLIGVRSASSLDSLNNLIIRYFRKNL